MSAPPTIQTDGPLTVDELRQRYYELLYAVACKYPGESRHATALRYIQEREASISELAGHCSKSQDATNPKP